MLSDGKSARKSSALRVMSPPLACASAPIITSATGRFATLPERLRWMWLFQAAWASERSSSPTVGGKVYSDFKKKISFACLVAEKGGRKLHVRKRRDNEPTFGVLIDSSC